jgi:hypothetical protein
LLLSSLVQFEILLFQSHYRPVGDVDDVHRDKNNVNVHTHWLPVDFWRELMLVGRGTTSGMRCRGYVNLVGVLRMTLAGKSRHKGETQQQTLTPEAKHEEHPGLETH